MDGIIWEGEWENGKRLEEKNGQSLEGQLEYGDGCTYIGPFKNGKKHGDGIEKFPNGPRRAPLACEGNTTVIPDILCVLSPDACGVEKRAIERMAHYGHSSIVVFICEKSGGCHAVDIERRAIERRAAKVRANHNLRSRIKFNAR